MSCLFRSLSHFISGVDENTLRKLICDYLTTNPPLIDDMPLDDLLKWEGSDSRDYIKTMRNQATWGGAIEIKAFCELFRMIVEVRVRETGQSIMFHPSRVASPVSLPTLVRIEWQGHHYEPCPY